MNRTTTIELQEGVPLTLGRDQLTETAALEIYKDRKIEIAFPSPATDSKYELCSRNVVGRMPVGRELTIRVAPKVPIGHLFQMLEVAYNLRSFELQEGIVDVDSLPELYERLASILARRVLDRARKGLYRSYLDDDASLQFVRGRIDVRETTRLLVGGSPAVHCHFQNHTSDLEENQILLWTLRVISRMGLQRPKVVSEVRAARRALTGAASLRPISPRECIRRLYNRLNDDYRPMHGLCRFFLESAGPGIAQGEHELIPFTVNMPRLFELFVAEWLKLHVPSHIAVQAQHKVHLTTAHELSFNMDIVLLQRTTRQPFAVLDTKYKADTQPDISDVQQVVAYAVELGVMRAILVYPTRDIRTPAFAVGPVAVECVPFNLNAEMDAAGRDFLMRLGLS